MRERQGGRGGLQFRDAYTRGEYLHAMACFKEKICLTKHTNTHIHINFVKVLNLGRLNVKKMKGLGQ